MNGVPWLRRNFVLSISVSIQWILGSVFGWFLTHIGRIRDMGHHWTVTGSQSMVLILPGGRAN